MAGRSKTPQPTRQKVEKCTLCDKNFGMLNKQHQCKRCLRAVCYNCSNQKAFVVHYDLKVRHRVCDLCQKDQENIGRIAMKCAFSKNSQITERWLNYIQPNQIYKQILASIESDYGFKKGKIVLNQESIQEIQKLIVQVRSEWNCSIYEFDYYLTQGISTSSLIGTIVEILQVLKESIMNLKINYIIVQQALFFSYFNSPALAHFFLEYIYSDLIPEKVLLFEQEQQFLNEIANTNFFFDQDEMIFASKFIETYAEELLHSFFLNWLSMTVQVFIFDFIFKNQNFYQVEKGLVEIIKIHISEIKKRILDRQSLMKIIFMNTTIQKLRQMHTTEDKLCQKMQRFSQSSLQSQKTQFDEDRVVKQCMGLLKQALLGKETKVEFNQLSQHLTSEQSTELSSILNYIRQDRQVSISTPTFGHESIQLKNLMVDFSNSESKESKDLSQEYAQNQQIIELLELKIKETQQMYEEKIRLTEEKQHKQIDGFMKDMEICRQNENLKKDRNKKKNEECNIF